MPGEFPSRIRADDQAARRIALALQPQTFQAGFCRELWEDRDIPLRMRRSCDRNIARQQVREEAHVGSAARVGVVAEQSELYVGALQSPCDQALDRRARTFRTEDDDSDSSANRLAEVVSLPASSVEARSR